ncbi:hypothetical protein [Acinetobacter sp. YH12081]|uniref:hypothetical protein n=1 Tax=Acinetobacter sp. YH12081 TaxID=2601074 RepID=UPI0015D1F40D|nr:hypothetical protein [Acinetobacter sp. YH12081]
MDPNNSETHDNVETAATENTGVESQEIKEWGEGEEGAETQVKEEAQEPEKAEPEKPKKNRAQERIEQLARENAELKRWRSEQETKAKVSEIKRPVIDDFEDFGKYEEALEQYHIDKAEERVLAKLDERESSKSQEAKQVEMQTAIAELEEQGIDFNTYAQKAEALPQLPIQLDQFGLSAVDTLKLAKDLLDDEDTYIALSQMNQVQAAMKIGQIIESKKTKTPPSVSKAPKPINPVKANAPAARSTESMSDNEFLKSRGL